MKKRPVAFLLALSLVLAVISYSTPLVAKVRKISVTVSIAPQIHFLEKIGGERVEVNLLLPPGKDPHSYAPTPNRMAKLAKSDLLFLIGVPFERTLLPKIRSVAPNTRIVQTQKGIRKRKQTSDREEEHHEHEKEHGEEGHDPHIWLAPPLVKIQARHIVRALTEADPVGASYYSARYGRFMSELDRLHESAVAAFARYRGRTVYVFHPSFGYFTDAYGLKQKAVETEGNRPKIKDLAAFVKRAKKENVRVLFVQPQFDPTAARKIANAIDATVVTIDPLAEDYLANMERMVHQIRAALD